MNNIRTWVCSCVLTTLMSSMFIAFSPAVAANAAKPDPDRESTTPTRWHWSRNRTEEQINQTRDDGQRIIDIERSPTDAGRFDAVFVKNTGVYQRNDGWWLGFTRDEVVAKIKEINGRITDLEPSTINGRRVFAFASIRNEGEAQKDWWWNYDLTPDQITADINKHGIRLIDLDAYTVDGKTLYSYVGIKNQGVDSQGWWWYHNVSPQFVTDKINEHGARLIDIEDNHNGNLSVIMVKSDGTYWWWGHGLTEERMTEMYETTGSRIISLDSHLSGNDRRYAFVSIDNSNEESRRLRNLIYKAYDTPKFGDGVIRGFLVKQVGGPTLAELAAGMPFQPLSTLKLLPYLYTMIEIDKGNATLDGTSVSWVETTKDDPTTSEDDRKYDSCLKAGSPNTKAGSAKLADALPTMMWESHNRTLDAFLDKYGPAKLTERAHQLGLAETEMHYGCQQGDGPSSPWASNRTTLFDLEKLFEGVEKLEFVKKASTRKMFFENMINLDYDGASYTSPITGTKVGPLYTSSLRDVVKREAGPAKQGIVEEFLKHVVLRGKGGSGGPNGDEMGYSDFLYVTLPFKQNGQIVLKTFVVGYFIYKLKSPTGCSESDDRPACKAIWQPEIDAREEFRKEFHTAPIRMALKTW